MRRADRLFDIIQVLRTAKGPVTAETAAIAEYGEPFAAAVEDGLVMGVQFHPEKSGETGLAILRNFLRLVASREPVLG